MKDRITSEQFIKDTQHSLREIEGRLVEWLPETKRTNPDGSQSQDFRLSITPHTYRRTEMPDGSLRIGQILPDGRVLNH